MIFLAIGEGRDVIQVQTSDGTYIRVASKGFELLLRHGKVRRFLRDHGWAEVGRDPLRGSATNRTYFGRERRRNG
jgi:hypothetical protein